MDFGIIDPNDPEYEEKIKLLALQLQQDEADYREVADSLFEEWEEVGAFSSEIRPLTGAAADENAAQEASTSPPSGSRSGPVAPEEQPLKYPSLSFSDAGHLSEAVELPATSSTISSSIPSSISSTTTTTTSTTVSTISSTP